MMAPVISPITPPHTSLTLLLLPRAHRLQAPLLLACDDGAPKDSRSQERQGSGAGQPACDGVRERRGRGGVPKSRIGSGGLDKVRFLAASDSNEHGATGMKPASYGNKRGDGYYPIFLHSLFAGLVPPFSD